MKNYARIQDGVVFEFYQTDGDITEIFPFLSWVDITGIDPPPQTGWSFNDGVFSPQQVVVLDPKPELMNQLNTVDISSIALLRTLIINSSLVDKTSDEYKNLLEFADRSAELLRIINAPSLSST